MRQETLPMEPNEIIGRRLREICEREHISVCEFARRAQVSVSSAHHWARGDYAPTAPALYQIATTYHVSVDWLLGLSQKERRN